MLQANESEPADAALSALWQDARGEGGDGARAKLVERYMRFARIMAAKAFALRGGTSMEFGDYLQYATVGLIEAVDRFDPERAVKFETFAASRINGAILNGIAHSSDLQEQVAARKRLVSQRVELMRDAPASGSPAAVFACLAELAIGLAVGFALENSGMYQSGETEYADNSYDAVELKQLQQKVQALVDALPEKQRQVISSHYLQQIEFSQIAVMMKLSKGRIAQLHREALIDLRRQLKVGGSFSLTC